MRHRVWMTNAVYYVGTAALLYTAWARTEYLLYAAVFYLWAIVTLSVGYHRLFCHGAFEANRFWHWFFALSGVLFVVSSPMQWVVTHATHHKNSDTDLDPYARSLTASALLKISYKEVPLMTLVGRRLLRDRMHIFVDRYYSGLWGASAFAFMLALPELFFFAYLPALGAAYLVVAIHQTFSHAHDKPHDLWFMELVLPSAGEWLHNTHHKRPRSWNFSSKWYHFDMGAFVVRLIRSRP